MKIPFSISPIQMLAALGGRFTFLLGLLIFFPASHSSASPGDLDPNFGNGGKVTSDFHGQYDVADSAAIDSSGRIVVAGSARTSADSSSSNFALARFTAVGQLDASFGTGGKVTTDFNGNHDEGVEVTIDSSGRILLAGTTFSGSSFDFSVARYTSSGALDASFGTGGKLLIDLTGAEDVANDVAVDSSGRVLLAGSADGNFAVVRLTSSGALDSSFGTGGVVSTDFSGGGDYGFDLALDASGRILLAGQALVGGSEQFGLVRYTAAGVLDSSFGAGGKVTTSFPGSSRGLMIALDASGRIQVGGQAGGDFALVRYTSAGVLDTSFGSSGKVTTDFHGFEDGGSAIALDATGLILVSGWAQTGSSDGSANFALARYTSNGVLDTTFGASGKVTTDFNGGADRAAFVALDSSGRTVVAGPATHPATGFDFAVARYLTAGPEISLKFGGTTIPGGGSHGFPSTNLGAESSVTVTITNAGSAPLTNIVASITPANPDFRVGTSPPSSLADGATATFTVIFDPQMLGNRTGTLHVTSNAAPSPYVVHLSGTGIDTIAPVVSPQAADLSVVAGSPNFSTVVNTWIQNQGDAAATDNSGSVTWSHNYVTPPLPGSSATITFTATDPSNNQATTAAQLIIIDQTPPVISPSAANLTVVDGVAGNATTISNWLGNRGGAGATDNSGSFTWSHDYTGTPPTPGTSVTITFTATDGSNNSSNTAAQLIVLDQTPPLITAAAAPLTVACDDPDRLTVVNAWLAAQGTAAATDNSGSFTWSHNFTALPVACGVQTVTFEATDPSGNFSYAPAQLTVVDDTAPVITTPASGLTVESDGAGNVAARTEWLGNHGGAVATDNCGTVNWSHNFTGLPNTLPQTVPVTFSVSDSCGNGPVLTEATFIIQDTTPPALTTPASDFYGYQATAAASLATFLNTRGGAQATDIAGPVTWSNNYDGTLPPVGGYDTVTFTATDTVGLSVSTTCRFFLFPPGKVWIGPATGSWSASSNWHGAGGDHYVDLFDFQNTTASVNVNTTLDDLHIGPGDEVVLVDGADLTVAGGLIGNAGILRSRPSASATGTHHIILSAPTSLEGPGKLIFSGPHRQYLTFTTGTAATAILTVGAGQEITATEGTVASYQHTAIYAGLVNQGTVSADGGGLTFYSQPKTNNALMRAINGGFLDIEVPVDNTNGTIFAGPASTVHLESTLTGGTATGTGRLLIDTGAGLTGPMLLDSGLNTALDDGTTTLTGTITNNGLLTFGSATSTASTYIRVNGPVSLDGTGQVLIQNLGRRQLLANTNAATDILTVGAQQEITTDHRTNSNYQSSSLHARIVNHGTITADRGQLSLYSQPKTNHNVMRAINGGFLNMEAAVDNTNGTLFAGPGSTLYPQSYITGGTITGTGTLLVNTGANLVGPLLLDSGLTTAFDAGSSGLAGTITLNGLMTVGHPTSGATSNLYLNGPVELAGTGKMVIQGGGRRQIRWGTDPDNVVLTVGSGIEITTDANTGLNYQSSSLHAPVVNHGIITADGGGLTIYSGAKTNHGTMRAINGGRMAFTNVTTTNYNGTTDTLTGGRWEVVSNGAVTWMDFASSPVVNLAPDTTVRLSGANASFAQLSSLRNIAGTLVLENGKTLATSGNMVIPGVLQYGLPPAPETTRLAITGNVDFTGTRIDVTDLGLATGSYLLATWTGTLTGAPVLGSLPSGSQHGLVLDPVAKTLRLEVNVTPPVQGVSFTVTPGTGADEGKHHIALSGQGAPDAEYRVEASTDLTEWTPVSPVLSSPTGALSWDFLQDAGFPRRFYRFKPE